VKRAEMARKKRMILIVNGGDSEVLLPTPLLDTVAVKKGVYVE
jgi:hypothetical protein